MTGRAGLNWQEIGAVFDSVLDVLADAIRFGKTVGLIGPGTLRVKATAPRHRVCPGLLEKVQIPAGKKVSCKVALELKKSLGTSMGDARGTFALIGGFEFERAGHETVQRAFLPLLSPGG